MDNLIEKHIEEAETDSLTAKINVGVRVRPGLKADLTEYAEERGLTLASLCESVLENCLNYDINEGRENNRRIKNLENEVNILISRLRTYECLRLYYFHEKLQGQEFNFLNTEGKQVNIKIETVADTYKLILNSFRLKQ